jgi:type IV secretory pathway VirB2 component (pilin)
MSKKSIKILATVLLVIMMIMSISAVVFAYEPSNVNGSSNVDTSKLEDVGNQIFTVIRTVGILLSVIILAVLGIKYMMGSAEEKAEYKKTMMPYIIGALLLFAAATISQFIYNAFTSIS